MSDRITRKDCEGLLRRLTAQTNTEPLAIHEESGVKRVVSPRGSGLTDHGWPGFLTYRELSYFLRGMVALAELR